MNKRQRKKHQKKMTDALGIPAEFLKLNETFSGAALHAEILKKISKAAESRIYKFTNSNYLKNFFDDPNTKEVLICSLENGKSSTKPQTLNEIMKETLAKHPEFLESMKALFDKK
jgi:hypothetical protein